jgi:hypothetical protein
MSKNYRVVPNKKYSDDLFGRGGNCHKALIEHFAPPVKDRQERTAPRSSGPPTSDQGEHMADTVTIRFGEEGDGIYVDVGPEATANGFPYPLAVEFGSGDTVPRPFIRSSLDALPKGM